MKTRSSVPEKFESDIRSATEVTILYEDGAETLRVLCHPNHEHFVEIELRPFIVVKESYVGEDEQGNRKIVIPLEKVLVVYAVDENVPPPYGPYAFAQWHRIRGKLQRF